MKHPTSYSELKKKPVLDGWIGELSVSKLLVIIQTKSSNESYTTEQCICLISFEVFHMHAVCWIKNRPHRHKTFEYSQGNSQLKYLNQRIVELRISSTLIKFSCADLKNSQLPHSQTRIFELRIFFRILNFYDRNSLQPLPHYHNHKRYTLEW
jgi:hypothetical protein